MSLSRLRRALARYDKLASAKNTNPAVASTPKLPSLYELQQKIFDEQGRLNVAVLGRRTGKTYLATYLLGHERYGQANRLYVAPTHRDLINPFEETAKFFPGAVVNKSLKTIKTPSYRIDFHSAEASDRIRGNKYSLAVLDECGEISNLEYIINEVISPALLDYAGTLFAFGTPKGQGYFYELFIRQDAVSWNVSSHSNPFIPQAEIDNLRNTLPERVFQQEIEARFTSDGLLFQNVGELATASEESSPYPDHSYAFGVDIAFNYDYSAIVVLDKTRKRVVRLLRGQWPLEKLSEIIDRAAKTYQPTDIFIDATGMGIPVIQYLHPLGLPIRPITFTAKIKTALIQNLMVLFEQREITLLKHRDLISELSTFEERNGRYNAASGNHDDIVIALALACWSLRRREWI